MEWRGGSVVLVVVGGGGGGQGIPSLVVKLGTCHRQQCIRWLSSTRQAALHCLGVLVRFWFQSMLVRLSHSVGG